MNRSLWAHYSASAWLISGTALSGVLSYVAVTLSARVLGPQGFGLLGTLLAVSALASLVLRPSGFAVTHLTVATHRRSRGSAMNGLLAAALVSGLAVSLITLAVLIALADPLTSLVGGDVQSLALVAPLIGATACLQMTNGVISGVQRFSVLAAATVADAAVRLLATAPLVVLFGVPGSLCAYLAGQIAAILFTVIRVGGLTWQLPPVKELADGLKTGVSALSLVTGVVLLQNGDLVLLRWYGQADASGLYAACASVGNLFFSLAAAFYLPAFPRALAAFRQRQRTSFILYRVLAPLAAAGAAASVLAIIVGGRVLTLVFGDAFEPGARFLPMYLAKITVLVLVIVLGQHALAVGRGRIVHLGIPSALSGLILMAFLQPDPVGTATIALLASLLIVVVFAIELSVANPPRGAG